MGVTTGIFSDALASALDVMAFSHDVDLSSGTKNATKVLYQNPKITNTQPQVISNGEVNITTNGQQPQSIIIQQNTSNIYPRTQIEGQNKFLTDQYLNAIPIDSSQIQISGTN